MPRKEAAEDPVTRETWLMYYLWRVKGFRGSISELSRELGYEDDSAVNKRISYVCFLLVVLLYSFFKCIRA